MTVPQFLRFYPGYTADTLLQEYAVRFFALVNAMYRIKADESLDNIMTVNAGMNGNDSMIDSLKKQSRGLHGIVQEVRNIKR